MTEFEKRYIEINDYKIATFSCGEGDEVLLIIHGGPGSSSKMVREAHNNYANKGFRVVTWDQLGCGESDKPDNDSYYNLEYFTKEVECVISRLKLSNVRLLGRSWGGVLAIEYCLNNQDSLKSLVLGSTTADIQIMQRGFERAKQNLGYETYQMMYRREIYCARA